MSLSEYQTTLDALDDRARSIMAANLGKLAPHTSTWRELLTIVYLRAYLTRATVADSMVEVSR